MQTRTLPRILYGYLFRELLTIFGLSLLALSLLVMVVLGIQAVQGGYSLRIILPWILESLSYSAFFTVPLSLLVSATLTYGRFVADREYTAAIASGVSPLHIMAPIILLSGSLCVVAMVTQGTVLPHAHYKQRNITRYLVKQLEHLGDSKKGKLQIDDTDGMVYWDEIHDGRMLRGVHIEKRLPLDAITFGATGDGDTVGGEVDEERPTPPTFIAADTAILAVDPNVEVIDILLKRVDVKYPNLEKGELFPDSGMSKFHDSMQLSQITVRFPINEKTKREGDWTNAELAVKRVEYIEEINRHREVLKEELPDEERKTLEDKLAWFERRVKKVDSEVWFRRALALSVLSFGLLAFPVCAYFRHSHRMVPFFIGIMLVVGVYYPLMLLGEALVKDQGIFAPLCMNFGNIVLLGVAGFLTGKLVSR